VKEPGFKNEINTYQYYALGDICRFGTGKPNKDEIATIREDCLEPIKSEDLILVFIYVGALEYEDEKNKLDYTQSDSYLIENKVINDIEIYSVWRTPMNTFITNCKSSDNPIVNDSFIMNVINNAYDSLNEYGNVSNSVKLAVSNKFQSINIPKILVASILCKNYEIELYKEIIYYINKSKPRVLEFQLIDFSTMSFGDVMTKIKTTIDLYNKFNEELVKTSHKSVNGKRNKYDPTQEKKLPSDLLNVYKYTTNKLLTISVEIENANTLLDIVNLIFNNGIEARIAVNSVGIAEGGELLNEIQETILILCKILMPPTQQSYTIKDECLGTFILDHDREKAIQDLAIALTEYNNLKDKININTEKYQPIIQNINQYDALKDNKIGQVCGHIKGDYLQKIKDTNLDEFTTSRIKTLTKIYSEMNNYIIDVINKV